MSIVWGLELRDSVTPSANAAANAMGTAAKQATVLQRAMNSASAAVVKSQAMGDVAGVRKAAANYQVLGEALGKLPPEFQEVDTAAKKADSVFSGVLHAEIFSRLLDRVGDAALEAGRRMVEMAIDSGEAVRRLTATLGALAGGGDAAGASILGMLRQLETQIPQSETQVASWARQLEAAGVTDMSKLRDGVKAIAGAEALVEGGGARMQQVLAQMNEAAVQGTKIRFSVSQLAGTGVSEQEVLAQLGMTPKQIELARKQGTLTGTQLADAMVKAVNAKSAGPLAAQMSELGTVFTKAKDEISRLFEGLNFDAVGEQLRDFFSVFDLANPSGQALKSMIGGAFHVIGEAVIEATKFAKDLFLHLVLWGLEAANGLVRLEIVVLQVKNKLKEWQPEIIALGAAITVLMLPLIVSLTAALIAWATTTMTTVLAAMASWLAATAAQTAALYAQGVAMLVANAPLILTAAAVGLVVFAIVELVKHWDQVKEFFDRIASGAAEAAKGLIDGLVNGIKNGVGLVVDAVTHLSKATWNALKSALHLGSPSELTITAGVNVAQGLAIGMQRGTPQVLESSIGMSTAAVPPSMRAGAVGAQGGAAPAASGGGATTVHFSIGDVHINASHATTPQEHRAIVEEEFMSLAERLALMVGRSVEPA